MALATAKSIVKTDYQNLNVTIVGAPKVGKSTFASQLGGGVYVAAFEPGYHFLEVFKSDISKWQDFENLVTSFHTEKHSFKHLVIDTVDIMHGYAEDEICRRNKVDKITDLPYGSGFKATKKLMMNELDRLNKLGMGITFITHTKDKEFTKDNIKWSGIGTSMSASVEEQILGLCDLILFIYIDKDGSRKIRTKPTKWIQCAGDRSNKLPELMPLDAKLVMETLAK